MESCVLLRSVLGSVINVSGIVTLVSCTEKRFCCLTQRWCFFDQVPVDSILVSPTEPSASSLYEPAPSALRAISRLGSLTDGPRVYEVQCSMRLELAVFSSEPYVQRLGASIMSYANDRRTFPGDLLAALDRASKEEDGLDYSRYGWMHKDQIMVSKSELQASYSSRSVTCVWCLLLRFRE